VIAALVLLVFALLGTPLFVIIVAAAMLGFHSEEIDLRVVTIEIYRLAEMPILLAIPLFTFAGYLLGESQAPHRLVRLSNALLGWLDGGLAIVALVACALFTAFTGASGVTIVALGALLYPALRESNYPESFSLGLVTTSGSLGLLFAPALPLILYGIVAQQMNVDPPVRIEDLFAAGLIPGLMMLVLLSLYSMWRVRGQAKLREPFDWREALGAIRGAGWEIPLPIVVLGGIYGGAFALSEAAAVTALYVLIVEVGVRREISLAKLPGVMRESMVLVGAIMIILGVSLASTNYLIDTEVPTRLPDPPQRLPAPSGDDPRHFLGHRDHGSDHPADRDRLRRPPGPPRDHLPGEYADRLHHAACRNESLHRESPLRSFGARCLSRDPSLFHHLADLGLADHVHSRDQPLARWERGLIA
jgi:tripartite ATP-independent transporter DctM subunit